VRISYLNFLALLAPFSDEDDRERANILTTKREEHEKLHFFDTKNDEI
jgi:hypothetical protein